MWRSVASNGLTLLIVAALAFGAFIGWSKSQYDQPGPLAQATCFKVGSGARFNRVADQLADRGAITHASLFRLGAKYEGLGQEQLKAGSFVLPEEASMQEIVAILTGTGQSTCGNELIYRIGVRGNEMQVRQVTGEGADLEVTAEFDPAVEDAPVLYNELRAEPDTRLRIALAEGTTVWQVVEALKSVDFLNGEVPELPAEGMIAPDSYEVASGTDRAELVAQMVAAQEQRIADAWAKRTDKAAVETREEMLKLASIIEKETALSAERGVVAGVFTNRLKQGIRLETDPTVIYGVTKGQGILGRGLRRSELDTPTEWNTYQIDGLPKTPIANPGVASLEAAVNPEDTDYIFFVADGTGGHAFAATLAEHEANVAKWREIEAQRAAESPSGN